MKATNVEDSNAYIKAGWLQCATCKEFKPPYMMAQPTKCVACTLKIVKGLVIAR